MNRRRFLVHFLVVLGLVAVCSKIQLADALTSQDNCPIAGEVIHWEYDRCFLGSGTDDEEHPLIKACVDLAPTSGQLTVSQGCDRKKKLKAFMCEFLRARQGYEGTQEKCIGDDKVRGRIVKNGGIGGE